MNRIYRYSVSCGRSGSLEGMFAVDDVGEACLRALIESKRRIHFGEVLGKHSEVIQILAPNEIQQVEATPEEVATVLRVMGIEGDAVVSVISGFCPLQCDGTCEFDGDADAMLKWAKGGDPNDEDDTDGGEE